MTDYGPTDNQRLAEACQHCWHVDSTMTYTVSSWPPATPRVCCFCGLRELYRPPTPPIPDGHGPYYPQSGYIWSYTGTAAGTHYDRCACNPKNGGSGVCNCTLSGPTITNNG